MNASDNFVIKLIAGPVHLNVDDDRAFRNGRYPRDKVANATRTEQTSLSVMATKGPNHSSDCSAQFLVPACSIELRSLPEGLRQALQFAFSTRDNRLLFQVLAAIL